MAKASKRIGVLTATGLIVGDGLFNVVYSFLVGASNNPDVLAVVGDNGFAVPAGLTIFTAMVVWAYARMRKACA